MELNLARKVAVITGGSSGIGRAISLGLAAEGVHIAIIANDQHKGDRVIKECEEKGVDAVFISCDVSDENGLKSTVNEGILKKFGKIDILINSAAPYVRTGDQINTILDQKYEISEKFIDVILKGAIHSTRAVISVMMKQCWGRIIYIGSDVGRIGDSHQPVYAASKAGVVGFMKSIAQFAGPYNIMANCVSPALTLTEEDEELLTKNYGWGTEEGKKRLTRAYPTRKLATAEDIANMVVFLCSDRAADLTGQVISVNGGFCMP